MNLRELTSRGRGDRNEGESEGDKELELHGCLETWDTWGWWSACLPIDPGFIAMEGGGIMWLECSSEALVKLRIGREVRRGGQGG